MRCAVFKSVNPKRERERERERVGKTGGAVRGTTCIITVIIFLLLLT